MKKGLFVISFVVLILIIPFAYTQGSEGDEESCGFFCKIFRFVGGVFNGEDVKEESARKLELVDESASIGSGSGKSQEETDEKLEEKKEEAIEEQIEVVEEKAVESLLSNVNVRNPGCEIITEEDSVRGTEGVPFEIIFTNRALVYEIVDISCDQFERYGKSAYKPYRTSVPSSLRIKTIDCDWGRVTSPTVYFLIVSDENDNDLCATPVTVLPEESDADLLGVDGCFKKSVLDDMKKDCESKGFEVFTIPDANNCDSIYCGGEEFSQCTPEPILEKATFDCEAKGENYLAYRYSEEFEGQGWPCAQIRCSECPTQEEIDVKKAECLSRGDGWDARLFTDFENSGCQYIVCDEPESEDDEDSESEDNTDEHLREPDS